jgi:hypothetical protein
MAIATVRHNALKIPTVFTFFSYESAAFRMTDSSAAVPNKSQQLPD